MNDVAMKDHLFISYATEDSSFAEWLALRLTIEGYKVWCDKTHLLGGESYPKDIDDAIKNRSFRLLALLSKFSIVKPNPMKERTLALNIAKEREIDFLIPLNVDGLSPTELDWMTSDLTFIPFQVNWAAGFKQLLKKLKSIETPQDPIKGRINACDWFAAQASPTKREEILRTNILPVIEVPITLQKFELEKKVIIPALAEHWPFYNLNNSKIIWAFSPPENCLNIPLRRLESISWQDFDIYDSLQIKDIATSILRKSITVKCFKNGMKRIPKNSRPYFPEGLLSGNNLRFTSYDGKKTYIKAVGERTFRSGQNREKIKYHLAPNFRLMQSENGSMNIIVSNQLYLTDLSGYPLEGSKVISRRKKICQNWWNHEWISRILAVVEWLSDCQKEIDILHTENGSFRILSSPIILAANYGIDESTLISDFYSDDYTEIDDDIEIDPSGYDE